MLSNLLGFLNEFGLEYGGVRLDCYNDIYNDYNYGIKVMLMGF